MGGRYIGLPEGHGFNCPRIRRCGPTLQYKRLHARESPCRPTPDAVLMHFSQNHPHAIIICTSLPPHVLVAPPLIELSPLHFTILLFSSERLRTATHTQRPTTRPRRTQARLSTRRPSFRPCAACGSLCRGGARACCRKSRSWSRRGRRRSGSRRRWRR